MAVVYQPSSGEFKHGLFSCCGNCGDCLFAGFCPECYTFVTAQAAGKGLICSVVHCVLFPLCLCCLRSDVRSDRGIQGSCIGDLLVSFCCPCCAVIQIKREITD